MYLSSILAIDRALPCATTPGQSGPGSDGNKGVLRIPQSSNITGASPSDYLVSYPGHSLGRGVLPFTEMQLICSIAPVNWARDGFMLFPRALVQSECKQTHPGFELGSMISFPMIITIMLRIKRECKTNQALFQIHKD